MFAAPLNLVNFVAIPVGERSRTAKSFADPNRVPAQDAVCDRISGGVDSVSVQPGAGIAAG